MGQSLPKVYIHVVFSTRYRAPLITKDIKADLFSYIGALSNGLDCKSIIVGGYNDHIHILSLLSSQKTISEFVREIKKESSKWIKTKDIKFDNFYWQKGYAAFSVSPNNIENLIHYIQDQEVHHLKSSFQDECRKFFKSYNIEYDERYVWD